MSEDEKGFVIKDKRRFSPEGEEAVRDEEAEAKAPESEPDQPAAEADQSAQTDENEPETGPPLPEVNFSTFVFSLSTSALMHLGELPDPGTGEKSKNLPLAKQTIDILGMFQEKTRGNLDEEEENLLKNLLYELRIKFVAASSK